MIVMEELCLISHTMDFIESAESNNEKYIIGHSDNEIVDILKHDHAQKRLYI